MLNISTKNIRETYKFLRTKSFRDMKGIHLLGNENAKNIIGILMMTHGNEPSGIAAAQYILSIPNIENILEEKNTAIIFCVNNIDAADEYFSNPKKGKRYMEHNMNRLPHNIENTDQTSPELQRAQELIRNIYPLLTYAIDIHSVPTAHDQMIIDVKGDIESILPYLPVTSVITHITNAQKGIPISYFAGGKDAKIPVIGIEAGQHEHEDSKKIAIECAKGICKYVGILPSPNIKPREFSFYSVEKSIIPPNDSYHFIREFLMFEEVKPDTVILSSKNSDEITADVEGHILIPRSPYVKLDPTEEACFLSRKKRLQTLP